MSLRDAPRALRLGGELEQRGGFGYRETPVGTAFRLAVPTPLVLALRPGTL